MKNTLTIARILTWFNLLFWGGFLALMLLSALALQVFAALVGVFVLCAIPLHSYAALQLQRAIRFPNVKLSNHTPVGIRFVGLVALFFGISTTANAFVVLRTPGAMLATMRDNMPNLKQFTEAQLSSALHLLAVAGIVVGLAVVVNVLLNTRLLRWYYLVKRSDNS
ncbi:MAG TPA: hypothetical protein VHE54_08965 [Puia sp.]|nr:hypothetical protein [Puia sp.]